nr:MAG TPA_asm: hypothetical protein [Caudoviricetes sp.]DAY67284.1 MAG TPA: hypothetical protein [Caudoviricetes sp.]
MIKPTSVGFLLLEYGVQLTGDNPMRQRALYRLLRRLPRKRPCNPAPLHFRP